ncbi:MAG TPA: RDD family protein [Vulgatibacter sp.]|nr:RDD family protein [Vulgatibacter sp.]
MNDSRTRSAGRNGASYPKAEIVPRVLAKVADLLVASAFWFFVPGVGVILALAYLLACDGLPNGQSPGKRLLGIKAMHLPTRRSCAVSHSVVRNLPIALAMLLAANPFLLVASLPILAFELYLVITDPRGARIGDVFADTQVIDGKVPFDAPVVAGEPVPPPRTLRGELGESARFMADASWEEPPCGSR